MPKVKTASGKVIHYPYTPEGMMAAKAVKEQTAKSRKKANRMGKK